VINHFILSDHECQFVIMHPNFHTCTKRTIVNFFGMITWCNHSAEKIGGLNCAHFMRTGVRNLFVQDLGQQAHAQQMQSIWRTTKKETSIQGIISP